MPAVMTDDDSPKPASGQFDLDDYVPFYLNAISNKWTSTSSRIYIMRFGLGVVEWRVLAALAAAGSASSLDIVNMVGLDPASVSKAMRNLEQRGAVIPLQGRFVGRTKPYRMTDDGLSLFKNIRNVALRREALLLHKLDAQEKTQLLELLRKIYASLPDLQESIR
jgi:DNA-binding MarR family transcriptional regulator